MLVAEGTAGIAVLRSLERRQEDVVGVLAIPAHEPSTEASVWAAAQQAGYRVWPAERVTDPVIGHVLRDNEVDILLNVYSPYIVHEQVLRAPRLGSFNLHPGPLPAYAGRNSVSWAILNGETSHGVTLHRMDDRVDGGAIVFQETFPISDADTGLTLGARCVHAGIELVLRLLDTLRRDPASLPAIEQDRGRRSYFGAGAPRSSDVAWTESAAAIVNYVRACDYFPLPSPWDSPLAILGGRPVALSRVSRTHEATTESPGTLRSTGGASVLVASADEWVSVDKVRIDGRYVGAAAALDGSGPADETAKAYQ